MSAYLNALHEEGTREDLLREVTQLSAKTARQQVALRNAKEYIEAQPRNEVSAHVLAIIDGVLTSPDYVP